MSKKSKVNIETNLYTDGAKAIYASIKGYFSDDELAKFQFIIADYCNERSILQRLQKDIASADVLVQTHVNSHGEANEKRHPLLQARAESQEIINKLSIQLQLTPRSAKKTNDDPIKFEMP